MTPEQKIKQLETQVSMLVRAGEQVLSSIDGSAQNADLGIWALRAAITSAMRFQKRVAPGACERR